MKKPLIALLLTATLAPQPAYLAKMAGSPVAHAADATPKTKLRFAEEFRRETVITREADGDTAAAQTDETGRGTLKLSIDIPFSKEKSASFDATTPFSVKLGGFEFGSTLGSDPQYKPGQKTATLILAANSPSGNSRVILATTVLNWERDKLTVRIDADIPAGGKPVAAEDFLASLPGRVKAETTAQIQIADHKIDMAVPFTGKVTRKAATGGTREIVIVELKN